MQVRREVSLSEPSLLDSLLQQPLDAALLVLDASGGFASPISFGADSRGARLAMTSTACIPTSHPA